MHHPIQIPEPCNEDWNAMKIGVQSRFCASCTKDVIDFTLYSKQEIVEYFMLQEHKKICGRFKVSQLDFAYTEMETIATKLQKKYSKTSMALFVVTFTTALLSSCTSTSSNQVVKPTKKNPTQVENGNVQERTMVGKVFVPEKEVCSNSKNNTTMGNPQLPVNNVKMEEPEIMGILVSEPLVLNVDSTFVHEIVDEAPEFPGGTSALRKYIADHLVFPRLDGFEGGHIKIYLKFIVTKYGKVVDPVVQRAPENTEVFVQNALDLVRGLPDFKPGRLKGEAVNSVFYLPVSFHFD